MLPRRLRLTRAALTHSGKEMRATSPHFSVSVRAEQTGSGVVVSKKTEKTAVGRHRLKRRVLNIIAPYCKDGASLTVYARAGSSSLSFQEISQELLGVLDQLLGHRSVR